MSHRCLKKGKFCEGGVDYGNFSHSGEEGGIFWWEG